MDDFYAHSTKQPDKSNWEPYPTHRDNVSVLAEGFGARFGAGKAARLLAEVHDLGKLTRAFQDYIAGKGKRGPDHSTAGARELWRLGKTPVDQVIARILAFGVAGHHAGLPDSSGSDAGLEERIKRTDLPKLDDAWRTFVELDADGLLPIGFRKKCYEIAGLDKVALAKLAREAEQYLHFQFSLLGRMLFSCLVDADYLATEAFYVSVGETPARDRDWPKLPAKIDTLVEAFVQYMARKRADLPEDERDKPLNRERDRILAHIRARAALPKGVFTLDVPTGGGKTLASLAFALDHARIHRMDRIVFAIPFTSIIDQSAKIFRDVLGEGFVLEHHSAIDTEAKPEQDEAPGAAKLRLAMENWAAPIVATTNVQLFESLFADRPARCRKLHNLANAVIILDECQTIPLHVLRPCVAALDELARNYGASIVLCTATQPALLAPNFHLGFKDPQPLAPEPRDDLHRAFRRVTLRDRGPMSDAEIASGLGATPQGLVIVNTRAHATALYRHAKETLGGDGLIHLSTRQTAADRLDIIEDVKRRLAADMPCRVVATSLIEAGVDLSFPRGWRALAGLDQIIQAAGRINREWRWAVDESFLYVFVPTEVSAPPEIEAFAKAMERVAPDHPDLFAPAAITKYFEEVYWQRGDDLDKTPMRGFDGKVRQPVLGAFPMSGTTPAFRYRTVGEAFRLIEERMKPVIVAIDEEAQEVLRRLRDGSISAGAAARLLQRYVVQVPPKDFAALVNFRQVALVDAERQFAELTDNHLYTREEGLLWEKAGELGIERSQV